MSKIKKLLFGVFILMLFFSGVSVENAKAAGASLYFAPSSGTYVIGGSFNVSVKVNSGGQEVNAVEGGISFDSNLLEVISISKGGSIFPFWTVSPTFSNSAGTINFSGGMPPPAYKGATGHIISVKFKAKKAGKAAVRFASGAVLANDGKGTNILASMGSASYIISPKVVAPPQEKKTSTNKSETKQSEPKSEEKREVAEYNTPVIKSETHKENEWSNQKTVEFNWTLPEKIIGVSIAFDQEPTSDPGPKADGLFDKKIYENVKDGVWYLHLKFDDGRKWGTIAHYRIMIDTVAPTAFKTKLREIRIGEWPVLEFESSDKDSGLAHYEVFVGSLEEQRHIVKSGLKELELKDLEAGKHTAIVKAVDNAGNETISNVNFEIEAIPTPEIVDYPREIKSNDKLYISGRAIPDSKVLLTLQSKGKLIASTTVMADGSGKWFYLHDEALADGRYVFSAIVENKLGIRSRASEKKTFLVSAPVFTTIGTFVVDYFTVFVSLLFMILVIVALIVFIVAMLRRKLRKETYEIEDVLRNNFEEYSKTIDQEFAKLKKFEGKTTYKTEKTKTKNRMKKKLVAMEDKIMKEVKDVEKILK